MVLGSNVSCLVRPGLVDATTGEVYEIKTVKEENLGRAQLAGYLLLLNANSPEPRWVFGASFDPWVHDHSNSGRQLGGECQQTPRFGVITYTAESFSFRVRMVTDWVPAAFLALLALITLSMLTARTPGLA